MSLATNRIAATAHMDFRADERRILFKWANRHELEVSIRPPDGVYPNGLIFVGYGEGVAHWTIFRADSHLWLCSVGDRTEQGREGAKVAVESFEDALAKIIIDTEA